MNLKHLLGTFRTDSSTIFDEHLLLIAVPLLFIFAILFTSNSINKIQFASKVKLVKLLGLITVAASSLFFVQIIARNAVKDQVTLSPLFFFNNIDVSVGFVFGGATLLNRHRIARVTLLPLIIFAGARLINNPDVELDTLEIIVAMIMMCSSIMIFTLVNKNVDIKDLIIGAVLMMSLAIYLFLFNEVSGTSFSTMSLADLRKNPVYEWVVGDTWRVLMFMVVTLLFEVFAWVLVRFSKCFIITKSFAKTFKVLFVFEKNLALESLKESFLKTLKDEFTEVEELKDVLSNKVNIEEETFVVVEDNPEQNFYLEFKLPSFLQQVVKINSVRAPSLFR